MKKTELIPAGNLLRTGDILGYHGDSFLSNAIKGVTFSDYSHVGIIYDQDYIFETDIGRNASLRPLNTYKGKRVSIFRRSDLTEDEKAKIKELCEHYHGTKYSYLDIGTNLFFFWLHPAIRRKLVARIGTKGFMICSEITARILFEASKKFPFFEKFEEFRPGGLINMLRLQREVEKLPFTTI